MGIFSESSINSFGQDGHIKFLSLLCIRLSVDLSELQIFQETKSDPDAPHKIGEEVCVLRMSATGAPFWYARLHLAPKSCLFTVLLTQKLDNNINCEKMQACM